MDKNKISRQIHIRIALMALFLTFAGYFLVFKGDSFVEVLGKYGFPAAMLISYFTDHFTNKRKKANE